MQLLVIAPDTSEAQCFVGHELSNPKVKCNYNGKTTSLLGEMRAMVAKGRTDRSTTAGRGEVSFMCLSNTECIRRDIICH